MQMSMDNEFDAFTQGVEPGGLRSRMQIKLLITFIVSRAGEPMKDSMIIEALQLHGLANYFEASQAMEELISGGNLTEADGLIYITPKGEISVDELAREIPRTVKETALADAMMLLTKAKRERENSVEIKKTENGCYVTFKIMHGQEPMMELSVYAADMEQAQHIKNNFIKDPSHIYATVIASLFV